MNQNSFKPDSFKIEFKQAKDWLCSDGSTVKHKPYIKFLRTDIESIFKSKGIKDPYLKERLIVAQVYPIK